VLLTELLLALLVGVWLGWWLRAARLRKLRTSNPPRAASFTWSDHLRAALEWCLSMSGASRIVLWQMDHPAQLITPIASVGAARPAPQSLSGDPLTWAVSQKLSLRLEPPPIWSATPRVFAVPVPTSDGDELVLTFEVADELPLQPTQFDGLGTYVAGVINVEAQRKEVFREQSRAGELIATLRTLPTATDADALSEQLARAAYSLINGSGSIVALWDGDVGTVIAGEGDAPPIGVTFSGSESVTALAARAAATIIRAPGSLGALPLVAPRERLAHKPKAMIAVPLKVGSEVIGVVAVWRHSGITPHAAQDLETLAPYAALQLRHARELGAIRTMAERDALTGLNNRHSFDAFFSAEAARFDRYQRPFALVIFDIDHFKSVNDRYGHDAGDFILQKVGEVIRGSLRNVDFAARLGGEEFVVVLPETGLAKGVEIAERVRTRTQELALDWRGQYIDVRVSAGVSAIPECVPRADALLRSADTALYQAKRQGRNQVMAAERSR
jgi:diguanylate cyclase (GGDEF)-like protein